VDDALGDFDSQRAGKALATFIDDLSNWYVRRSRRRFWVGDVSALATLQEALHTLTLLLSPMIPFITEHVWQELIRPVTPGAPESVHLADFPTPDNEAVDRVLSAQVAQTRRIVELGRAARAESSVKIRQPLSRALISATGWVELPAEMKEQIADELNVLLLEDIAQADGDLVDVSVKANFRSLGAKYGSSVHEIARSISQSPPDQLVQALRAHGSVEIESENGKWLIHPEDLVVTEQPRSGWTVVSHDAESVALDLQLSDDLIAKGQVREVIRFLQEARKSAGFDISDRIHVRYNANPDVKSAILAASSHIQGEILALTLVLDSNLNLEKNELGLVAELEKNI